MYRQNVTLPRVLCGLLATLLITGCAGGPVHTPPANGQVVFFDTDAPVCGVESFWITITSANLLGNGSPVPLVSSANPARVDFARLEDFTSILGTASVRPGTYTQLQLALTYPELIVLNTSTNPPTTQLVDVTLATTTLAITLNPPLVVSSSATSGLMMDFNLPQSLQVEGGTGQMTGTLTPQITITTSSSGPTVGEATSLYGVVQSVSTKNLPSGFTGSFALAVADGTQPTLTILSNAGTVFEGDGVTGIDNLSAGTFVELDATANISGQIIAQIVDEEEQASFETLESAILGEIIGVTRDSSGNATAFTMYVADEVPPVIQDYFENNYGGFIGAAFPFTLAASSKYFTNWGAWNQQAFTFGPQTLGLGEKVAVFHTSTAAVPVSASQVFLRPRSAMGNFKALQVAGSDNLTGGFTLAPCSGLFGGKPFTVLTYADTVFSGLSGLSGLTSTPTLDITGVFFYAPTSGTANDGATWTAPTWVMQAREVHQLPN